MHLTNVLAVLAISENDNLQNLQQLISGELRYKVGQL